MELLQLKYFVQAAECENFSKVAESHFLPQSAISHTIARLERELECKLFDRHGKRVALNAKGRAFYKRVSSALQNINEGIKEVKESINIVTMKCYSGARLMPPVIRKFTQLYPEHKINLRQVYPNSENYDILIAMSDIAEENACAFHLFREKLFLAVPISHPYADKKEISVSEISSERIITVGRDQDSSFVRTIEDLCAKAGVKLRYYVDTQDLYTAQSYVEEGFGVMFYPEITWGEMSSERIRFIQISDEGFYRDISAFVKNDRLSDDSIMKVKDHLVETFSEKQNDT